MMRTATSCALLFLAATTAAADDDVRSIPLALHPAAAPSPALKYALLPELRDSLPGNAVTHYRQAVKNMKQDAPPQRDWYPAMEQWMAVPLKDLPREEVGKFLKQCETTFQEVDAGARSEDCDWGITEELRKKGIATLLPDVQEMRAIASLLTLRIRYQLAEGRPDKAAHSLQIGFALSRHVGDGSTLIEALVGIAIGSLMVERLQEFVQLPDAPNLYWSLTDLPHPYIDMRKPMQGERVGAYGTFPGLAETAADLNAPPWTAEQVAKGANLRVVSEDLNLPVPEAARTAVIALRVLARHGAAKKRLIEQGRPRELVDAMPHLQVAMLDAFLQYDQALDEVLKWQGLPFWEAQPGLARAEQRLKDLKDDADAPAIPLAKLFLPATVKVYSARTRLDRRIAALRCVEAVRLYAAAHDGQLPASLEDVKDVPLPLDPVNGKPFDYRVVGDRAFFGCPPLPGQPANNATTPTYELSMKR